MGASSWLKNKAKETVTNIQAERAYNKERKLANRDQYDKGYNEGSYKRGLAEGSRPAPQSAHPSGGNRGRSMIKASGDLIGGFGTGAMGIGFGFGEEKQRQALPPQRVTRISKSGSVTISEPYERKQAPQPASDPYDFWGSPPRSGGQGKKDKEEKHPYDIF